MNKIEALAMLLICDEDEIEESEYDKDIFQVRNREYMILTDEEANTKAATDIKNTLWAFNSEFIIDHSKLPYEATEMLKTFQEKVCESANETIEALINDIDGFIEDAIKSDGRAHFLNTYDDQEHQQGKFYIYRVN